MIDNIVATHLLLSDYRLERWLLRYPQKSGDGSGSGGGGGGHVTYPRGDKQHVSATPAHSSTPMIDAYSRYVVAVFVKTLITTAVSVVKQTEQMTASRWRRVDGGE